MIRVALLTTDSREHFKDYANPDPYFGTAPEALIEGFKLLPEEVEIHVLSCLQEAPVSSPAKLAENIYYHALRVPNIGWMKTGYQGCIRAVRRKLREIRPDIVHGQGTERDCAISAVYSGFPNILTLHGVMSSIFEITNSKRLSYYWFAKHFEAVALSRTSGVIAISPYVDRLVSDRSRQTWLIPNALRLPFFLPSSSTARAQKSPRLVNIGVIGPNKRQLELLETLITLRKQTQFAVTFVGKGDRDSTYVQKFLSLLRKANALNGEFEHWDFVSAEKLVELYDASDALIHFSREESFGLIFAEALARNLSVFASDVGAVRQISEDVPHCRIFDADDFAGLASAIGKWIRAGEYLAPRSQTPNTVVESRYSPRVVAGMHLKAYQELLNNLGRRHDFHTDVNRSI
jgi:glycosyltransferase involved in cell wall biosynthesis